jgi:hypothetical protein
MRARDVLIMAATVSFAFAFAAASGRPAAADEPARPNPVAPKTDLGAMKGDLSEKLDKSNGVIRPQGGVDPAIEKKAPAVGDTPVIRPPGAPGGDSNVQPK